MLESIIIGLGTSFMGSLAAFAGYLHYDLEGWFAQRRIRKGEKRDRV